VIPVMRYAPVSEEFEGSVPFISRREDRSSVLILDDCPYVPNSRWQWGSVALSLCGHVALDLVKAAQDQGEAVGGGHWGPGTEKGPSH
jgi:hypothetical protein